MIQKARKYLLAALRLLISGAALFYVFSNINVDALMLLVSKSNPLLLFTAFLFFIVSKIISAYRLRAFFGVENIHIENLTNMKLYLLGMYYNLFLPGGIGGDGYKVYFLNRQMATPVKKSIRAILFDRITGVLSLIIMCLFMVSFIPELRIRVYTGIIAAVLSITVYYIMVKKWFGPYYPILHKTNIQSFGVQAAQLVSAWFILMALGEQQHTVTYLFVFLISSVVAVIPFTLGGIGARELTFLYAAKLLSLNTAISVSLSLLFFLITAVISLAGIYYSMRPELIRNHTPFPSVKQGASQAKSC